MLRFSSAASARPVLSPPVFFAAPLTLLYGASGVGKSSLLRAGVLPELRRRASLLAVVFPSIASEGPGSSESVGPGGWQTDPLGGLKETVALALYESGAGSETQTRYRDAIDKARLSPLREFLAACHDVSGRRLMLILDQFEEYSLFHTEDDAFAEQLPAAVAVRDLSLSFLISLREDALGKLDRFKGRIPSAKRIFCAIQPSSLKAAPPRSCARTSIASWSSSPMKNAPLPPASPIAL